MKSLEFLWAIFFHVFCLAGFAFLIVPLLVIIPLGFNAGDFLTFPMTGYSLRWYWELFGSSQWLPPMLNSFFISLVAAAIATCLGTAAALGLTRTGPILRYPQLAIFLMPVIMPVAVLAVGIYFAFVRLGLQNTFAGLILAHAGLGAPFVVTTVGATLKGFDERLVQAGQSLGASPATVFRRITFPLVLPGILSGAVFAFAVSFDDVVIALFLAGPDQRTLPLQMFSGMRENTSPAIAAAAAFMMVIAVLLLVTVQLLRRRTEMRIRGRAEGEAGRA
ncbi:MAG: ABC transporter permease [Parvibaculaceae bacterium]